MTIGVLVAIAAATLVSEDLTAVGVGLALQEGSLPAVPALFACFAGIYLGDVALWAAGRFGGRRVLSWRIVAKLPTAAFERLGGWIDAHPGLAIVGSRFLPGTRLPLYVAAGVWSHQPWRVLLWMLVAVALWTPLIVLGAMLIGDRVTVITGGGSAASHVLAAAVCIALVGLVRLAGSHEVRTRGSIAWARLRRWEFWPSWVLYAPVAAWIMWLAVRHRSLTVFTAANPIIEDSGFVGESKSAILAALPPAWVMPWAVIEPGCMAARLATLRSILLQRQWRYPLVAKPDVGQRGTGVNWVRSAKEAERYLAQTVGRVVLQVPHEGPYEAGLFYVRLPDERRGRIFSITDKRLPVLVGDGQSTVAELIRTHPRFRLQSAMFLARLAGDSDRVLELGERLPIGQLGNHSQGAEFLDGRHLWTAALEARVDGIARGAGGFYFGRFDVRYRCIDAFKAGEDLGILELNGVTSEATHIYGGSLWQAWRTLLAQWTLAFAIGDANRKRGHQPSSLSRLLRLVLAFGRR